MKCEDRVAEFNQVLLSSLPLSFQLLKGLYRSIQWKSCCNSWWSGRDGQELAYLVVDDEDKVKGKRIRLSPRTLFRRSDAIFIRKEKVLFCCKTWLDLSWNHLRKQANQRILRGWVTVILDLRILWIFWSNVVTAEKFVNYAEHSLKVRLLCYFQVWFNGWHQTIMSGAHPDLLGMLPLLTIRSCGKRWQAVNEKRWFFTGVKASQFSNRHTLITRKAFRGNFISW